MSEPVSLAPRHVLCFGNPLHADDGFAAAVAQSLNARALPEDVRVFEVGTRTLDALVLLEGCRELIVVDAARPQGCPGRLSQPDAAELLLTGADSVHAAGVAQLLRHAALLGARPPTRILCAEASQVASFQPGLSAEVRQAVPLAVRQIRAWLGCSDEA